MADKDAYDRQFDLHRRAFDTARRALAAEFGVLTTAKEVEDLAISRAEEYGVEHTLEALVMSPKDFHLDRAPSPEQMRMIKPQLTAAYEANAAMDRLLGERERAASGGSFKGKPSVLQLFGRGSELRRRQGDDPLCRHRRSEIANAGDGPAPAQAQDARQDPRAVTARDRSGHG